MFTEVVIAAIGGVIVVVGLLMEHFGEKDWYKDSNHFDKCKSIYKKGEWFVIAGVGIEVVVAILTAIGEWNLRQLAQKNDPLKQPVAQVSAVVNILVNATNVVLRQPNYGVFDWISVGPFGLELKDCRWFDHHEGLEYYLKTTTNREPPSYYTISLKFEYAMGSAGIWGTTGNSKDMDYGFTTPSMTVTDLISNFNDMEMYLEFITNKADFVKGSARIIINGIQKDIKLEKDSFYKFTNEWTEPLEGLYLGTSIAEKRLKFGSTISVIPAQSPNPNVTNSYRTFELDVAPVGAKPTGY